MAQLASLTGLATCAQAAVRHRHHSADLLNTQIMQASYVACTTKPHIPSILATRVHDRCQLDIDSAARSNQPLATRAQHMIKLETIWVRVGHLLHAPSMLLKLF